MATQRIQSGKPVASALTARQEELQRNEAKYRAHDALTAKHMGLSNPKAPAFPPAETVDEWIAFRSLNANKYGYTPDGNLRSEPLTGTKRDVEAGPALDIPTMIPASTQQLKDAWKEQRESFSEPSMKLAAARRALLKLTEAYRKDPLSVPISDILIANRQVQDAERSLTELLRGRRGVFELETQRKELNFDWYRREVVEYKQYVTTTLPLTDLYMVAPGTSHAQFQVRKPLPTAAQLAARDAKDEKPQAPKVEPPKRNYTPQQLAIIRARKAAKG